MDIQDNNTKILIFENTHAGEQLAFKAGHPDFRDIKPLDLHKIIERHFPKGFYPDYPALYIDFLARDLMALAKNDNRRINIFIDIEDFRQSYKYPWLPFTIAAHCLVLLPQCYVYFRGHSIVKYSREIDRWSLKGPMECLRNLCIYLNTSKGDRPGRIFDEISPGKYVPFSENIYPETIGQWRSFSNYYAFWLKNPYMTGSYCPEYGFMEYFTHPYEHLPVRNRTAFLMDNYFTENQWKEKGYKVPDIDKAVFLHDQLDTIRLRPYWFSKDVVEILNE